MRKIIIITSIFMFTTMILFAQQGKSKVEVLYFKANLACCKARACNALQTDIQMIISDNYPDSSVVFKEIRLADEKNKELIAKYNAQSQTVILFKKKKKKEFTADVTELVKFYIKNQDKEAFTKALIAKIDDLKKK